MRAIRDRVIMIAAGIGRFFRVSSAGAQRVPVSSSERSITSPRFPGSYAQRASDCEQAIAEVFLRETANSTTPFVDLERVVSALGGDAKRAGWSEAEVTDAVIRLARRHKMRWIG
jgi:hypothetical protein